MAHIVLLGDSVFDNGAYVAGGRDVVSQLRSCMPGGWRATLLAVDGATSAGVARQLQETPADATHLVVSVGGNDALGQSGVLEATSRSVAETLLRLSSIAEDFRLRYASMLAAVRATALPVAVCTIYDPRFSDASRRRAAQTALAVVNDVILREAATTGTPVIDLRLVCSEDSDFANPIEPSIAGGSKIASSVVSLVSHHDFGRRRTEVFVH